MLKNLLEVLLGSNQQELNDEDEKIALAALCVRVAKSDNVYDPNEISSIDTELSQHFSISVDDAAALRLQAEELENDAPDTVRFTRAIKEKIELGKRRAILKLYGKLLWPMENEKQKAKGERTRDLDTNRPAGSKDGPQATATAVGDMAMQKHGVGLNDISFEHTLN